MAISSATLFHFMKEKDFLLNILANGFSPRYVEESYAELGDILMNFGPVVKIPMVCFCDIPLSQIAEHIQKYGGYGIGMTKSWGITNGLNPVLYASAKTNLSKMIGRIGETYWFGPITKGQIAMNSLVDFWNLAMYMKPYEGTSRNTGEHTVFYDEREWRYIPSSDHFGFEDSPGFFLQPGVDDVARTIDWHNKRMAESPFQLPFSPAGVRYLILKSEDEVVPFLREIDCVLSSWPPETVEVLKTKIITTDRITKDM